MERPAGENQNLEITPRKAVGKSVGKDGPLLVRIGNVTVKVYRRLRGPYTIWEIADYSGGKRRLRSFNDEAEARKEATRIARALATGQTVAAGMSAQQMASFGRAIQLLQGTQVPLEIAAASFAEAFNILGANRIVEAARFFSERQLLFASPIPVPQVVEEFLAVRQTRDLSRRYLDDLDDRLGRFAKAFNCPIQSVSPDLLQRWLDGLGLKPQGYRNYRTVVHTFFEHAKARRYVAENPVHSVEKIKVRVEEIEILTPEEMQRLLAAARRTNSWLLPALALGGFAGLRSAEIERLTWAEIDRDHRIITVGANQAKTATRRIVPMPDNLVLWLDLIRNKKGPVWPHGPEAFYKAQQACADETEIDGMKPVRWKANGLRHSFASYRFAQIQDAGRVAGEMGNSPKVVHQRYRELVKPLDAARWFDLKPA